MKQLVLALLKHAARSTLARSQATVVGITGSVGKSSCVYLLDAVMRDQRRTKTTFGSNSETGLPLEILGIRSLLHDYSWLSWLKVVLATPLAWAFKKFEFDLFIAEMGIDSSRPPKNMSYLLEIVQPDIGVLLSVAPSHTQQFAQELGLDESDTDAILTAIAQEKGKLVTQLGQNAHAVVNVDFPHIRALLPHIRAQVSTVGSDSTAEYRLQSYQVTPSGTKYRFAYQKKSHPLEIPGYMLSKEYGVIILTVIATACALGLSLAEAVESVQTKFILPPGRMTLITGKQGSTILDSSYNSSPAALRAVLETAQQVKGFQRKILVLGDMRELGPLEAQAHASVADLVSKVADKVILVGPKMQQYLLPELQKRQVSVLWFPTSLGVGKAMLEQDLVKKGDLIVVKGSQNTIFLEQVVFEIMQDPAQARTLLCRQEDHWYRDREKLWQANV